MPFNKETKTANYSNNPGLWDDHKRHCSTENLVSFDWVQGHCDRLIGLVSRVFANSPGDLYSISSHVIPKTLKIVLDSSFLNTQQYKVRIKDKVEQSRERGSDFSYTLVW